MSTKKTISAKNNPFRTGDKQGTLRIELYGANIPVDVANGFDGDSEYEVIFRKKNELKTEIKFVAKPFSVWTLD